MIKRVSQYKLIKEKQLVKIVNSTQFLIKFSSNEEKFASLEAYLVF